MTQIIPLQPTPLVPQLKEILDLAGTIFAGGFFPWFQNKEEVATAIMMGLELGLRPMFALTKIAVINGRPAIWGDAVPALIYASGIIDEFKEWTEGEGDNQVAHCLIKRKGFDPVERTFSVADAKQARLWDTREKVKRRNRKTNETYEAPNDAPWFRFPGRMLQMRARGFCVRDAVPDVTSGLYLREELDDGIIDVTPRDLEPPVPETPSYQPPGPDDAPTASLNAEDLTKPAQAVAAGGARVEARQPERPEKAGNELPADEPPIPPTRKEAEPAPQLPETPAANDARPVPFIASEIYREYYDRLSLAHNEEDVEQAWRDIVTPVFKFLTDAEKQQFFEADDRRRGKLQTGE